MPAGPVNELPEVFADPQIQHRNMLVATEHPLAGKINLLANPIRMSKTPVQNYASPPLCGQHTEEILRKFLNYNAEKLAALAGNKVI